jgi:hypothetical protein
MNHPDDDTIDALLRKQFEGPVADDGFCERLMQRLPPRRRRIAWPLWAGVAAGIAACGLSLVAMPWLPAGWHDLAGGEFSASAIALLAVVAGMSLLACWWTLAEADDR